MAKKLFKRRYNSKSIANKASFELKNKYYNVFLNKFDVEGMDSWSADYTLRKLFETGTIGTFKLNGELPIQCCYAVSDYGINWRPAKAQVVNENCIPGYPTKPLVVDEEIVIGYLQKSKKGMAQTIDYYISRMVQTLMSIVVNLETSKLPFLIGVSEDNIDGFEEIIDRIYENELAIFAPTEISEGLRVANTGSQYIVDKLWTQYLNFECDLLTTMGIDCNSLNMARVNVDQTNANNALINNINHGFNTCLKFYTDKCNELFGTNYSIKVHEEVIESIHQDDEELEEEVEEDGN